MHTFLCVRGQQKNDHYQTVNGNRDGRARGGWSQVHFLRFRFKAHFACTKFCDLFAETVKGRQISNVR